MANKINVLLVDDQEEMIKLFSQMLNLASFNHFNIYEAYSLSDASQIINNEKIDVAVLDLYLEKVEGLSTLIEFKQLHRDIPVVVVTGRDSEGQAFDCFRNGASDYLTKPNINKELLERACFYAVERNRAEMGKLEAQLKLRESEKKFRLLYENAPSLINH